VNPIVCTQLIPNSLPRQRNCYFSSSDAVFANRYEARRDYDKIRTGQIPTDGGWRIYSSGPGIYTNLILRHLFGLRWHFDHIEIDPVLPRELDRTILELTQNGQRMRYHFRIANTDRPTAKSITINGHTMSTTTRAPNPYRPGGVRIARTDFRRALTDGENQIDIIL
jgi:CRISPR-associated protein Csx3